MTSSLGGYGGVSGAGLRGNKIPSGYRHSQIQKFTPEQMGLNQQLYSHVGPDSYLNRLAGGDEELFNQIEAPALKQFGALQGGIASRFSGMGLGGRNTSGFQNEQSQAASSFAQQLQAQRQGLQMQALSGLRDFSSFLLGQEPYEQQLVQKRQKQPGFWHEAGVGLAKGIGNAFGSIF